MAQNISHLKGYDYGKYALMNMILNWNVWLNLTVDW